MATLAARTLGVTGVLIGPRAYFSSLARLQRGLIGENEAIEAIARRFHSLFRIFSEARATSDII
jgi:myo-inositol catabolism protein IolC